MGGVSGQSYRLKFALAAVLLVLTAAARLPFIADVLTGEEGEFAALVLNDPPTSALDPDHLPREIAGSIDGKLILSSFHRTVMPYIVLERLGRLFAPRHALGHLPAEKLTIAARLPFSLIFLLGSAGLIALTIQAATSTCKYPSVALMLAPLTVTLWSLTSPLAVGASIEPQVDGSAGVLLLGTSATLLALGNIKSQPARWRFLAAGVLAGLGKHEWALAFGAAALGAAVVSLWLMPARRDAGLAFAAFIIGLALAVALSYAISPADYRQGFAVMAAFYAKTGWHLWALQKPQWPLTLPVVALILVDGAFLAIMLRPVLSEAPGLLLAYLGATAIAVGYAISGWTGDNFPRYFAPPLVMLPIVFVALWRRFKDRIGPAAGWSVVAASLFGLFASSAYLADSYSNKVSIAEFRGTPLAKSERDIATAAELARNTDGIVLTQTTTWIYHQNIDFLWATKAWAESDVAENFPAFEDRIATPPQ
jgi:hypothetical protein